ncbi:MAG: hypothetical protein Q8P67_06230, partial [archaeon]|nr:hypothetical protein [archaeon]
CSTSMVEALPSPIRVMAGLTAEAARKYQPDMIRSLLGGFIMLRVIAPALVSPESYGIASNISPPTRRNLILIAKIMQNTANNIEFGDKEEWMAFANPFIRTYIPVLNGFLDTISSSLPISSLESAPQPFNIQDIDLGDLFVVHDAFWRNRTTLMHALSSNPDCLIPAATLDHFASFLNTLGPSPTHLIGELERIPSSRKDQFNPHRKSSPAASSGEDNLNRPMSSAPLLLMQPPGQDVPHWTEESLAETRFFFNGNATIDGLPSLYLILNRIQPSFFNSVDAVISHLYKVLERLPNSKYVLIVDLSWSVFTDEMKKGLRTYIEQLRTIFSRRYKKNLHKVFLIHPSSTTRGLILLVKAISSIKLDVKFVEIDDWQDLLKVFSPLDILLPESSKSTITKGYHVTKVNSKGKEQKRVIKITLNSLLNIDSSGIVTNEKLLNHIESFSVKLPLALPFQLDIIFCPEGGDALAHVRKTSIHRRLRRTSEQDQFVRRYLLDSPSDLQAIIEEIFHAGFLSGITSILPQEYQVVKVNASGKAQHRIFKLTGDSLLNLNRGCRIRDEISFAGIEMVELDSSDATILWLKKKTEPLPRKIICKDALSLFRVLGEGIERFKAEQPILLRTFQR